MDSDNIYDNGCIFTSISMADPSSSEASNLAWLWVIEYLARFHQLDPSILHDLIDGAPELSVDLGKGTMEMVALRCLEDLFGVSDANDVDIPSATVHKDTIDLSQSCEDVLQSILKERSLSDLRLCGPDILKWDIHTFITHKRASMPKCALELLKDVILEGSHPDAASLIQLTGLVQKNDENDRITLDCGHHNLVTCKIDSNGSDAQIMVPEGGNISWPPENENRMVGGDSHHGNELPFKRSEGDLWNENLARVYLENLDGGVDDNDLHLNAKRFKGDASCANNPIEQILIPQYDEFVATKRLGRSPDADTNGEFQHNQCESSHNANSMPPNTYENIPCKNILLDEINKDEPRASNGAPSVRTLQNVFVEDSEVNNDCGNQLKSQNAVSLSEFPKKITVENTEVGMDHLYEEDTSSDDDEFHHKRIDIAMVKSHFLSSQCTLNHVSSNGWTELNLCVKCSKDGQLLVCNAVGCPLVVHEKCLGSLPRFDEKGNFSCPFCAYSHVISKYFEAKRKASLARKDLDAFINKCTKGSYSKEHNNLKQYEVGDLFHKIHERRNLSEKEFHQSNHEGNAHKVNGQLKKEKVDRQPVESMVSCPDVNLLDREEEPDATPGEKARKDTVPDGLFVEELDRQNQNCANPKCNSDNQIYKKEEFCSLKEKQAEDEIQREVIEQHSGNSLEKPVSGINIDKEECSRGGSKKSINFNYSTRKLEKRYVYPAWPQLRRRKVPWTAKEEEMLKEGVMKFSCDGDGVIPWKKILEYGSSVFLSGRTAIDLKDKWRNICRASPGYK